MTAPSLIYSSDNGLTWTTTTSPFDDFGAVSCIAYSGSVFVAVGYTEVYSAGAYSIAACIATSSDGITWTQRTSSMSASGALLGVVWNGTRFTNYGWTGVGNAYFEYSSDGTTWTQGSFPTVLINYGSDWGACLTANGATVVAAYSDASQHPAILVSSDGITFADQGSVGSNNILGLLDIAYGGGKYLIATGNDLYTSATPTGGSWTDHSGTNFTGLPVPAFAAYGNGNWFAGWQDQLVSSTDAASWSTQTVGAFTGNGMTKLIYNSSTYILVGFVYGVWPALVARSIDLSTWTTPTMATNTPGLRAVVAGGGLLVAGGAPNLAFAPPGVPQSLSCK